MEGGGPRRDRRLHDCRVHMAAPQTAARERPDLTRAADHAPGLGRQASQRQAAQGGGRPPPEARSAESASPPAFCPARPGGPHDGAERLLLSVQRSGYSSGAPMDDKRTPRGARLQPRDPNGWGATRCCKSLFHYRCLHTWLNDDSEVETSRGMEPINTACPGCRGFVSKSASRMLS